MSDSASPVLNRYQQRTSASKLRGQYYTPASLVRLIVEEARPAAGDVVLDPSCGDGGFLCGVVEHLARTHPAADWPRLAKVWRPRLVGFDTDPAAIHAARAALSAAFRERLGAEVDPERFVIHCLDPLAAPVEPHLPPRASGTRLLILGNPPYVEAKRLSREVKATLLSRFPGAVSGAPDLYLYFVHVCLTWLRSGDQLALVLPNKLLVNQSARALRERLLDEKRLRGVWFATDTRAFGEAGVYPIVLFAGAAGETAVHVRRLTAGEDGLTPGAAESVPPEWYAATEARAVFPPPETPVLRGALERLLKPSDQSLRLGDVLQIRWSVSFHRAGLRERFVTPKPPDSSYGQRFIGGGAFSGNGEVTRYRLEWGGWWMDYHEAALRVERNPVPSLSLFQQPKIAICQNARTLRAAYDESGAVLKDTFLCGIPTDPEHPLCRHPQALVGLLCSRAAHFFFSHVFFGGHVNGGYLHFLQSFLVDLPVGAWTDEAARHAAERVRLRETAHPDDWPRLEEELEAQVSKALGLDVEQQGAIREWCAGDANWRNRERVRAMKPRHASSDAPEAASKR